MEFKKPATRVELGDRCDLSRKSFAIGHGRAPMILIASLTRHPHHRNLHSSQFRDDWGDGMFLILALVLLAMWAGGYFLVPAIGVLVHILLVLAIISFAWHFIARHDTRA